MYSTTVVSYITHSRLQTVSKYFCSISKLNTSRQWCMQLNVNFVNRSHSENNCPICWSSNNCHLHIIILLLRAPVSGRCILPWCPVHSLYCTSVQCVHCTSGQIDRLIDWELYVLTSMHKATCSLWQAPSTRVHRDVLSSNAAAAGSGLKSSAFGCRLASDCLRQSRSMADVRLIIAVQTCCWRWQSESGNARTILNRAWATQRRQDSKLVRSSLVPPE